LRSERPTDIVRGQEYVLEGLCVHYAGRLVLRSPHIEEVSVTPTITEPKPEIPSYQPTLVPVKPVKPVKRRGGTVQAVASWVFGLMIMGGLAVAMQGTTPDATEIPTATTAAPAAEQSSVTGSVQSASVVSNSPYGNLTLRPGNLSK
jgi:hypothetical protein